MTPRLTFHVRAPARAGALAIACVAALVGALACELKPPDFGRPCADDGACDHGYVCFDGACVAQSFPLLSDAGVVDAGGEGEGEGEGEGAGEGEGEGDFSHFGDPGDNCVNAVNLNFNTVVSGDTTGFADDNTVADCDGGGEFAAPDFVYAIEVPASTANIHVHATTTDNGFFIFVKAFTDCNVAPIACTSSSTAAAFGLDLDIANPPAGRLLLMVDGFSGAQGDEGAYTIEALLQ